jgi:hypothetical protein
MILDEYWRSMIWFDADVNTLYVTRIGLNVP